MTAKSSEPRTVALLRKETGTHSAARLGRAGSGPAAVAAVAA